MTANQPPRLKLAPYLRSVEKELTERLTMIRTAKRKAIADGSPAEAKTLAVVEAICLGTIVCITSSASQLEGTR